MQSADGTQSVVPVVCGLLVIDDDFEFSDTPLFDPLIWQTIDVWVACVCSLRAKQLIKRFCQNQNLSQAQTVLIEADRSKRYQVGLKACAQLGLYSWLFQPGTLAVNLRIPKRRNLQNALKIQYIDARNHARWRRTLVSNKLSWQYNEASEQLEPSEKRPKETNDRSVVLREEAKHPYQALRWSRQLQAQCRLLNESSAPQVKFELALTYLRRGQSTIAADWFKALTTAPDLQHTHKTISYTLAASLNDSNLEQSRRIAWLHEAIEIWPHLADSYFHLASFYSQQQQFDQAMETLDSLDTVATKEITALDSTMIGTRLPRLKAECLAALGQYDKAIGLYNQALHVNEQHYLPSSSADQVEKMRSARDQLYDTHFPLPLNGEGDDNCFKIIVAFWNVGRYLQDCIDSIAAQSYSNYEVILIDDVSNDDAIENTDLSKLSAFKLIRNQARQGPLKNQIDAVLSSCQPTDIVVVLDGDDEFDGANVLSRLNEVYRRSDCWATIGQFRTKGQGISGYARPILPNEDIGDVFKRQTLRFPVHLRSHRAGLLCKLAAKDPSLNAFRDENGAFFFYASDVAYCRVVLSLCGAAKIRYISQSLMRYNTENPNSVHRTQKESQKKNCQTIAALEPLTPLQSYTM